MPETAGPAWPHDGANAAVGNHSPSRPPSPWTTGPSAPATERAPSSPEPVPTAPDSSPAPAHPHPTTPLPTLDDLMADRPAPPTGPAKTGWRAALGRVTGGLIAPGPGPAELSHRLAVQSVQRSLRGPKTVVIVNPKGGAHKTTATLLLSATFGTHRGGYVLAWDNNETRGTLGWRSTPARHTNTAVDLLRDLHRFDEIRSARVGDLDNYVRSQGDAQFDVLASDEDAASAASIDADAFNRMHHTLSRFYRILCIDTGNNTRASNWRAAIDAADQLLIISTIREDTSQSAAWLVDSLRATGHEALVENAVTVLAAPSRTPDAALRDRLHRHFSKLTRAVLDVPHDPALVAGGPVAYDALSPASRTAWLQVTAAVADGL